MNSLRQLCAASILVIVLAVSAFAGEMSTPTFTSPPPPPPSPMTSFIDTPGTISTEASNTETPAIDSVRELALYLFDSMMSSVF